MSKLSRFLKDRSGAFAMQFALMVVPLLASAGLAIDGGRAFLARYELASAIDAAALAVGSSTGTNAQLKAIAQKFVDQNFKSMPAGSVTVDLQPSADLIKLKGDLTIPTFFMPIMGVNTVNVSAEAEVRRGGNNVEVALALDITDSMDGTRITALKTAASNLVDTVVGNTQSPYYSRVGLAPWANNVHVTSTFANSLRGTPAGPTNISAATWRNGTAKTITNATWKNGAAKNITGATKASQAVITSNGHGFNNGDYIYISGVSGMTQLNSKIYMVSDKATNTYKIKTVAGAYVSSSSYSTYSSGGTAQKCWNAECEVQITATSHGYSDGDYVYVSGVGGMTQINNTAGQTWTVTGVSASTFLLDGTNGPSTSNWTSAGTTQKCFTSTCEVQVTSNGHGIANNDHVKISGVGGMTQINTSGTASWQAKNVTTNTMILSTTIGPNYSNYTSGGTSQCLKYGCEWLRYTNKSSALVFKQVSNCVTERTGAQAYTDAAPGGAPLGMNYPGTGYGSCDTSNQVTPLTDDKTLLKNRINAFNVTGSTAGQIGTAWGWYLVSPNFAMWPETKNIPAAYGTPKTVKVAVLMTDGEFNTAHCQGVTSNNYGYNSNSERINCNSTNGAPFDQAATICTNMKAAGIKVYTVGFELTNAEAISFMGACATDANHAFLASNGTQLQEAFNSIATSISQLRISK